jgi:hypothetical protein
MGARLTRHPPVRSEPLYGLSFASILLCIVLWLRAKTIGEDERGNAERRALFVGLWPPMLWLIGDTLRRREERGRARSRGGRYRWSATGTRRSVMRARHWALVSAALR